jgi:arylsulfatase A-like enzyme
MPVLVTLGKVLPFKIMQDSIAKQHWISTVSFGAKTRTARGTRQGLFLRIAQALVFVSAAIPLIGAETQSSAPPNVIVIVTDDLGPGNVTCYDAKAKVPTPNIDRLAAGGLRMTQGYSADPMCWPSRGAILTGRYPQHWGNSPIVPRTEKMMPQYFKAAQYHSGAIGKWHQGFGPENHPMTWGFDEFFGFQGGWHDYFKAGVGHDNSKKDEVGTNPILRNHEPVKEIKYLTFELSEQAISFLKLNREQRFLLYLAYNARHVPTQAPKDYVERFKDERYAVVAALDDALGQLLDAIDKLGLTESTLVIFVGDNGGPPWGAGGLKGNKGQVYEGGIRIPFLARWPGRLPVGATYDQPVMHIDVLPTILAAAGLQVSQSLDGLNLLPYWLGTKQGTPHERLFWGLPSRKHAARVGQWKLVAGENKPELYDLSKDPVEEKNLATDNPDVLRSMLQQVQGWQERTQRRQ